MTSERRGLPLIGRAQEISLLGNARRSAQRGEPQIALITGASGAGKTTVVDAFLATCGKQDFVARGGCRAVAAVPFGAFAELLRPALRSPGTVSEHLRPLLRTLTETTDQAGIAGGVQGSRTRVFESVLEFLADLDGVGIVVLDDVQWADAATLELFTFLARNLRSEQVLIIVVCRDGAPPLVEVTLDEVRRVAQLVHIRLGPFDRHDLASAFEAARGTTPDLEDLRVLEEVTEGNAFFVEQVLMSPAWGEPVPSAVRTLLLREVADLPLESRHLVELLAVAGGTTTLSVAEEALGVSALTSAIDACLSVGILRWSDDELLLRHGLYREAILTDLHPLRVRHLHEELALVGESLAKDHRSALSHKEVARHWQAAGNHLRAIPALADAGRQADGLFAFVEALEIWTELIHQLQRLGTQEEPQRQLMLEAFGGTANAARWSGQWARSAELMTQALGYTTTADRRVRARYHERRAYYRRICGEIAAAAWDAERATALLSDVDPPELRASVFGERARLLSLTGNVAIGLESANEAVRLAREAHELALEANALSTLGVMQVNSGDGDAGVRTLQEARLLASTYANFEVNIRATTNLAFAMMQAERLHEGFAAATEALELARRVGVEGRGGAAAMAADNAINALIALGNWEEADARLTAHLDQRTDDVIHTGWLLGTRAQLSAATGRFARAEQDLTVLNGLPHDDGRVSRGASVAAAELACWQHRPADAFDSVSRQLDADLDAGKRAYLIVWCLRALGDLADLASLQADSGSMTRTRDQAQTCMATYFPSLEGEGLTPRVKLLIRCELERAQHSSDPDNWAQVATASAERPYERAYALTRQIEAAWTYGRGQTDHASSILGEAERLAGQCGASPLQKWVEEIAVRHNIPLRAEVQTTTTTHPAVHLTQREREVIVHLRRGLTNRKIGRALGISEKTASVHVSNILAKLGVANRTTASAVAQQLGL